jgi:hypothetical protein
MMPNVPIRSTAPQITPARRRAIRAFSALVGDSVGSGWAVFVDGEGSEDVGGREDMGGGRRRMGERTVGG